MKVEITSASIDDLDTFNQLHQKLYQDNHQYDPHLDMQRPLSQRREEMKKRLLDDSKCRLKAIAEDQVVGYLIGQETKLSFKTISMGEITDMVVFSEHRSKGIGKKLMDEFKSWCKEKGITRIVTDVYSDNKKAISFYQNQGMQPTAIYLEGEI